MRGTPSLNNFVLWYYGYIMNDLAVKLEDLKNRALELRGRL